jgi:hypothetical protein
VEETTATTKRKNPKNLRLSDEADGLLLALSESLGVTQKAVMEMAIRRMAKAEGIASEKGATE